MSGCYLADSPEHRFEPQDRMPDRCGFVWDRMTCGYDREDHEALWPSEPAAASDPGDLAAFLSDRYDEAERDAQAVIDAAPVSELRYPAGGDLMTSAVATAMFHARNSPKHRLADIKLKRAILAEHRHVGATGPEGIGCSTCHRDPVFGDTVGEGWCATVRQLGTEFTSHPAYRPGWAPEGA